MKLYFSPGACSLSPNIAAHEAGLDLQLVQVDMRSKKLPNGGDFLAINPKGYVPALELDDGAVLTEGPAIVQYLADLKPDAGLAPAAGTMARYRLQEWLTFIGTEIHKTFSALFAPNPDEVKDNARKRLAARFALLEKHFASEEYLLGGRFTVADGYLYTVLRWSRVTGVDLEPFEKLRAFMERVGARPAVQAAIAAEKLKG
ncbi:MAG: glutathione transferase GstA [Myxococcales bacterium]|nr:glutathione transferase GstA [Myxococcales bacterium]